MIAVDGDTATARSECLYAAVNKGETPETNELRKSGLFFEDELVRTGDGWRVKHRAPRTGGGTRSRSPPDRRAAAHESRSPVAPRCASS